MNGIIFKEKIETKNLEGIEEGLITMKNIDLIKKMNS